MGNKKPKYYVVWNGVKPGIYESWEECKLQVNGYEGAKYKSFESRKEAEDALEEGYFAYTDKEARTPKSPRLTIDNIPAGITPPVWNSIAVDAACSGNPGNMEYQGVYTATGQPLFHQGPFEQATNNVGEFLAIVHALAYLKQKGIDLPIYSDSKTAMKWVKEKKARTKLERNPKNVAVFDLIERAEKWLQTNTYKNPILKWDTPVWGEIPADFGRK